MDKGKKIEVVRHSSHNSGCFTTRESEKGKDSDFIDNFNFEDIDFIKIDVEGKEYEVLEGSIETI